MRLLVLAALAAIGCNRHTAAGVVCGLRNYQAGRVLYCPEAEAARESDERERDRQLARELAGQPQVVVVESRPTPMGPVRAIEPPPSPPPDPAFSAWAARRKYARELQDWLRQTDDSVTIGTDGEDGTTLIYDTPLCGLGTGLLPAMAADSTTMAVWRAKGFRRVECHGGPVLEIVTVD